MKSKKNSNLPINHSIWVVFDTDVRGCNWFNTQEEAEEFIESLFWNPLRNKTKPIKFVRDY